MWWDGLFGNLLLTFLVAMVPVLELRGAIPFGVARGLGIWQAIGISVVGNLLPVPFIILFIRQIFAWLRAWNGRFNALVSRLEGRVNRELLRPYGLGEEGFAGYTAEDYDAAVLMTPFPFDDIYSLELVSAPDDPQQEA